jgi:haloalkane dehalogenase
MSTAVPRASAQSSYSKLLFTANPGALLSPVFAKSFSKDIKDCEVAKLGAGIHYLQEDHPHVIGDTVRKWLVGLGVSSAKGKD